MSKEDDVKLLESLNLVDPDADILFDTYNFPDGFVQRVLGAILLDDYFFLQALAIVKPEYFKESAHRFICKFLFVFYEHYHTRPTRHMIELAIHEKTDDILQRHYFRSELEAVIRSYEPGIESRDAILDKLAEFAKVQAFKTAYYHSIKIFRDSKEVDKWAKIRQTISDSLLVERNTDLGLDYFPTVEERYARMKDDQENKERFSSGFMNIDVALGGGLCRGELGAFAGLSGAGKSLALVKAGKSNVMNGKNVLYLSLEMDSDKVAQRFDSMLTNIPISVLYENKNSVVEILKEGEDTWGEMRIKQFPAGSIDLTHVKAYLCQSKLNGFKPDLLISDYIGEFKDFAGIKTYESRQRLVRDLRGMMVEEDICGLTAMQISGSGRDAMKDRGYLDDDSLADAKGQVRPLDALWTISQNENETKANVGVIFVSKHRSGKGRYIFYFQRNPLTLEMEEITHDTYKKALSLVVEQTIDEVAVANMCKDSDEWKGNSG